MDPLSTTASVIAVIQITSKIFSLCRDYCLAVKHARTEIQRLRDEIFSLEEVLIRVQDLETESNKLPILHSLNKADGPLDRCRRDLSALVQRLDTNEGMRQFGLRGLKWPLSSKEVDSTVQTIYRHKSTFNIALTADNITLTQAVEHGVKEVLYHQRLEDRDSIVRWLSVTDFATNHDAARKKHTNMTGKWLMSHDGFKSWKQTPNSLIWVNGIPGCGKTILSSTAIEHFKLLTEEDPNINFAYFYYDFDQPAKQNVTNMLSCLIAQLCSRIKLFPTSIEKLHKECEAGKDKANLKNLLILMQDLLVLQESQSIFFIIDALDECPKGDDRHELLKTLDGIKEWSLPNLHMLVTSRNEPDIENALTPLLTTPAIPIEGSDVGSDIELYIEDQLSTRFKKMPAKLKAEIREALIEKAEGMFRWVFCQLDVLKKCPPLPRPIREALGALPVTLYDTYDRIILSIKDETCQKIASRSLVWLALSEHPMRLDEIAAVAAVSEEGYEEEEQLPDSQYILELLGSLVSPLKTLSTSRNGKFPTLDNRTGKIVKSDEGSFNLELENLQWGEPFSTLAHFSVKEYLLLRMRETDHVLGGQFARLANFASMAKSCILYLQYYVKSDKRVSTPEHIMVSGHDVKNFPLLLYSRRNWHVYLSKASLEAQRDMNAILAPMLFSGMGIPYQNTFWPPTRQFFPHANTSLVWKEPCVALVDACEMGVLGIVELMLEGNANPSVEKAVPYGFPLIAAIDGNYLSVAATLLEHGADVNSRDFRNETALFHTTRSCEGTDMMSLLLHHGANVNARDCEWHTPLHTAIRHGASSSLVERLLDSGADVQTADGQGRTLLHTCVLSEFGTLEIVSDLLSRGADVLATDINGKTAEQFAGAYPKTDIRELLRVTAKEIESSMSEADKELKSLDRKKRRQEEVQRCIAEMNKYGIERQPGSNPAWDAAVAGYAS